MIRGSAGRVDGTTRMCASAASWRSVAATAPCGWPPTIGKWPTDSRTAATASASHDRSGVDADSPAATTCSGAGTRSA